MGTDTSYEQHWEQVAEEWTQWARSPEHDAFWAYRREFRDFVPAPGAATLEVGCGEGRISRELTGLGHRVTATDVAPSLLVAAEEARSAQRYVLADAVDLPFADGSFDRVVAYNMLMDVPDVPGTVAEAARVLAPDGVLTVSVVHPFTDRGSFGGAESDAAFVVAGSYFDREWFSATVEEGGLQMHFAGWSQSLQDYVAAVTGAGLVLTELREPMPDVGPWDPAGQWRRMPLFLWFKAKHVQAA